MTGQFVVSPRARSGLEEIWDYTEKRWGPKQAETYIRQIRNDIETVSLHPASGKACPEVRAGYYKYRSGSHVLFYRVVAGVLDVVRILHERMDFERHI